MEKLDVLDCSDVFIAMFLLDELGIRLVSSTVAEAT